MRPWLSFALISQCRLKIKLFFTKILPGIEIYGIDVSNYAIENSKEEIKDKLILADATSLPFEDNYFDGLTVGFGVRNFENLEKGLEKIR